MIPIAIILAVNIAKLFVGDGKVTQRAHAAVPRFSTGDLDKASVDKNSRLAPTIQPAEPLPQYPEVATTQNTDSGAMAPTSRPGNPTSPSARNGNTASSRPAEPIPQTPAEVRNPETGKPPLEWSRLTDDWDGARPRLEDHGVTFAGGFAGFLGKNLTGGADTHDFGEAYIINANVTLDSEKLAGYEGGTFFINFRKQNGLHDHSLDGSFGATSHLYTADRTQISEIWYEQKFLDDKLRVRLGKIEGNNEFAFAANSGEFLNDFASHSATILDFPTNPDPAFGAELFVYPTSHLYAGIAVYDGSALEGAQPGLLGPAYVFHDPSHFWIGEIGTTWTAPGNRDGRLGVGAWYHTGAFARFDGGTDNGEAGPYLVFDQTLWRDTPNGKDSARGIAMFALAGYANPAVSAANFQIAGGLRWTGPLASRASDVFGFGVGYTRLSDSAGAGFNRLDELTVETFYKIRLNPWFSIQPDLQFIHNPDGIAPRGDSVMTTIEMLVDF